jgi:predicted enzyme related to lactoylglutathione lyase
MGMTGKHFFNGAIPTRASLGLLLGLAIMAGAAAAAGPSFVLPPLVQPASAERHTGKVIWADLVTPDIVAAKRFYGSLFGWSFNDIHVGDSDYSVARLDGRPVGGLYQPHTGAGEQRQPAWLTFISVRDVAAAERAIVAHGGKVLSRPKSYADRGRQAVFADPQGAVFAVLQSSSGDPQDFLAVPGEWIWSSVLTRDPDTDAAFYQNVFGYDVFEIPSDDGSQHVLLSTDDYARASLNKLPADAAKRHPHWLNFVRVESATDTAAKVEALGGRVLVKPFTDRHGGLVAVVADPAGAPFGLLEWTETDSKEGAK